MLLKKSNSAALLALVLGIPSPSLSQEQDPANILELIDMPLTDFMNIKVTVATKKEETITETPAVVSSYYTSDMNDLGLRTLKDILSFMPGVIVDDSVFGNTQVLIRGMTDAYGQKVLFLLDDIPLWMPVNSAIPILGFPSELIDHVEVIRGPAGVIYGTNASAGVIKVVTKRTPDQNLAFTLGSNEKYDAQTYWQETINKDHVLTLSLKKQEDDGYKGFYEKRSGFTKEHQREEEAESIYLRYNYKNLELVTQVFESQFNGTLHIPGPLTQTIDAIYDSWLVHGHYEWELENSTISLYSDYNNFYYEYPTQEDQFGAGVDAKSVFSPEHDNYRWRTGITTNYSINENTQLLLGIETEERAVSDLQEINKTTNVANVIVNNDQVRENTLLGQLDYNYERWRFLLGARLTNNSDYGSKITPRFSAVYNIDNQQSLKLLHSIGFNAPNFLQTGISVPSTEGNPDLDPEVIEMTDIAYSYTDNRSLFVANVYYLSAEDLIARSRVTINNASVNSFLNADKYTRYGAELDYQLTHGSQRNWKSYYNLSYHHQANRDKTVSAPFDANDADDLLANGTPRWSGSIGTNYRINAQHSIGGSLRYIDERDEIGSLSLINLNYSYKKPLNTGTLETFVTIRNVLNRKAENPDLTTFLFKRLPRSDDVNFLIGARMAFN